MKRKRKKIGHKVAKLLLTMIFLAMISIGGISVYSLYSMKGISESNNRKLGQTSADGAEKALEEMAGEQLQNIVVEKAAYIEEKFKIVESYVLGIAAQAADIYRHMDDYPDREVAPPGQDVKELTVQLLYAESLETPTDEQKKEVLKLGNIQDLLIQYFLLDEDRLALVMADVSGKGVPAALFMVVSRTLIRSHVMSGVSLMQAVEEINDSLCKNNKNGMFVTAWIGVLTISTGELNFVNAGHCRPLIRHADGFCEYVAFLSGLVLAGMEEAKYKQSQIHLKKGDTILLYTDGVTEATSVKKELYGEKRLRRAAGFLAVLTPKELIERIWEDVDRFQEDAEQFDDITMLAATYNGNGSEEKTGKPEMENIREFADFVSGVLIENGISMKTITKVQMTVDEIFSNICYYSGAREVTVGVRVTGREKKEIILFFEDDGMAYNPLEKPDPDVEELLENREIGGLGIYLVKKRMDKVEYEYREGKNRLTVYKADVEEKRNTVGKINEGDFKGDDEDDWED